MDNARATPLLPRTITTGPGRDERPSPFAALRENGVRNLSPGRRPGGASAEALADAILRDPRLAEEYRIVKRPLLIRAFAEPNGPHRRDNLVMVSSSIPGEGKTFTAINLAISMTRERDVHVLLVDAALSQPGLGRALGLRTRPGLSELIEDPSLGVGDVIQHAGFDKLSLISAGHPHPTGTELLASQRAAALVRELATRYDDRIVIFDTAPLLTSTEGGTLAYLMGQIVLVVEAERTPEADLGKAVEMLDGCDHLHLVLNRAREPFGRHHRPKSDAASESGRP